MTACGRFAPSATGPAHPGTMLAALLCWLDARSRGGRVILRIEDLDRERLRPGTAEGLVDDCAWLGLDWDAVVLQHQRARAHEEALDRLAALGLLYPSPASRAELAGAYDGRDRGRVLGAGGWRACAEPLRAQLDIAALGPDEGGCALEPDADARHDPVVRRRDGAVAYHLASVVDDAADGVDRVVRGRDLAGATAVQSALRRALGLRQPAYRHHFLLLERQGEKLAKLHGAVAIARLRARLGPRDALGQLAQAAGLSQGEPCSPRDLVDGFAWARVRTRDLIARWDGERLRFAEPP